MRLLLATLALLCGCDESTFSGSHSAVDFDTDLCTSEGFRTVCWDPDEPVAAGTVWGVWRAGEQASGAHPGAWMSSDSAVSVEWDSSGAASLRAESAGSAEVSWSDGASSDAFTVQVRDADSLQLAEVPYVFSKSTMEEYSAFIVHGSVPDPVGERILIQEGGSVLLDAALLDVWGDALWFQADQLHLGGSLNPCGGLLCLDGDRPFSGISLAGEVLSDLEVVSASEADIASLELVVVHQGALSYVFAVAENADGERIWSPEVSWLYNTSYTSAYSLEENARLGTLTLLWEGETGARTVTFGAVANGIAATAVVELELVSADEL